MTYDELKSYLESIGGLVSGYHPDKRITDPNSFSCGQGWYQLIHDLIEELLALSWDKYIFSIKEKFGGLRFYSGSMTSEMHELVDKYEHLSFRTCENCGNKGSMTSNHGWIKTLCQQCAER